MSNVCTVVTGAASGIGFAVARQILSQGGKVAAVDRDAARLEACFGGDDAVLCVDGDLTTDEGFVRLTTAIKQKFDAVGGFVHAAGFDAMAPLGLVKSDDIQRLTAIHAAFPVRFLGWMARKGNYAENAAGVLISSLSAHEGAKGHVAYAAAKGAVEGLLRPAAAELLDKGIRLNAVVLGVVETEMSKRWLAKLTSEQLASLKGGYPLGLGSPENVAGVIGFLLSPAASWITGQTLVCDGGHLVAARG